MQLSSIILENFRNYTKRRFDFKRQTTLLVGGNASGKTNVLEAIFLLATGKSFRAQKIEEMIFFGKELARVSGSVEQGDDSSEQPTELQVLLTRGELQGKKVAKRRYSINGAYKRQADFTGKLVAVGFRPENLDLVLGNPAGRREFLDEVLSQIDREYRRSLVSYEKALVRRNKLLDGIRDEGIPRTQLAFWDQLLVKHGQIITNKRAAFIDFIGRFEVDIDTFRVKYNLSVISEKRLLQYADEEVAAGYTLVGPHKDDFLIFSGNGIQNTSGGEERELVSYGSRGEQRLAVLWLKLAELAYVLERIGDKPVLLLDDIFSELDREHRELVFQVISQQQTIVTTTDLSLIESKYIKECGLEYLSEK